MVTDFLSKVSVKIKAPISQIWEALTNPEMTKQYMYGAEVASDWKVGSPITFSGVHKGMIYHDKGIILRAEPGKILEYTHFSYLSGLPDLPENYHKVCFTITQEEGEILLTLTQDNNSTEEAKEHSDKMWTEMLEGIKDLLENKDLRLEETE